VMSGVFSAAEMAISSCNTVRLSNEAENGNKKSARALRVNEKYDDTLSAILLTNNLVNIAASSLSTVYIILLTGSDSLNWLMTVIVTVLIIIFGETVPKILSKKHANSFAATISGFILFLIYLFWPINYLIVSVVNLLTGGLDKYATKGNDEEEAVEELQSIIETAEDEGVIDQEQSEIVSAAIDFSDRAASDVMTARVDVEAININDSPGRIRRQIIASTKSRMPVYEGSIDNVIGIIHLNSLLKAFAVESKPDIRKIMLEPCFVYKTSKLPHVLDVLKEAHIHLAIVTDEYSGTCGVITMEDVLEEIVGEIWDETDEIEVDIVEETDGRLIMDGDTPIGDFLEHLNIREDDFDYASQTAGGFCIEYFGDFPKEEDRFSFREYEITILEASDRRVEKIEIKKMDEQAEEDVNDKDAENP